MSDQIKDIKDRLAVSDVVADYVKLQQKGTSLKACCPFHNEKTPSFVVSDDKGIWHCFGCNKGGDIFTFVQEIENIEFKEALQILADKAGIELKRVNNQQIKEEKSAKALLELAALFFEKALQKSESGKIAREYITKRNIPPELVQKFRLGYSPNSYDILSSFLVKKGYTSQHLAQYGLVVKKPDGSSYDRFRHRLMFPIADQSGNIIAFGARELEGDRGPKYLNSPETPAYYKSKVLYGLHLAKRAARKHDAMIIVEGYMDVIASHKAGIENVVAASGTALTIEQVQKIKRITNNIYLAFDMDSAGAEATKRGVRIALSQKMNIKIVQIPNGKDPDEAVSEDPKIWIDALKNAQPVMDYYFSNAVKKHSISRLEGKKKIFAQLAEWISYISNPIEKDHYVKELSEMLAIDSSIVISEINSHNNVAHTSTDNQRYYQQKENKPKSESIKTKSTEEAIALAMLEIIIANPGLLTKENISIIANHLTSKEKKLAEDIKSLYTTDKITQGRDVFDILESHSPESSIVANVIALKYEERHQEGSSQSDSQKELNELLHRLEKLERKAQLARMSYEMKQAEKRGDTKEIERLMIEFSQLSKKS